MSQKKEKYARELGHRVDRLEEQMYSICPTFEAALTRVTYENNCRDSARAKASRDRHARRELEAECAAKTWQTVAYAAIITAILVLIVAISAVKVKAIEPQPVENELTILSLETMTHSVNDVPAESVEDFENEHIEAALLAMATTIEDCTVTYYCICQDCCGKEPSHPAYAVTASGYTAVPGITVSVDPDVILLGSDVLVDFGDGEIHYLKADDTGAAVKGNHIDICVARHEEAELLGVKTATVHWVAPEVYPDDLYT